MNWALFRYDVRRDVRNCALFLFLFYAFNLIVSFVIEIVMVVRQFSGGFLSDFLNTSGDLTGVLTDGKTLALISIVGIIAGSLAFVIYRKKRFFTDIALPSMERLKPSIFIILVVATQGVQYVTGLIAGLVETILPEGVSIIGNYESTIEILFTPVGLLYVVLIGPIFEELIFRGAILGSLRKYGDNFAILFSALFFGLYHAIILQMPFAFVMGLVLGYAGTHWSLRTSIALHIISNGLSVLISYEAFAIPGGFGLFLCAVVTLILAIALRRPLAARIRAGAPYYGRVTYENGFSSIAFWLFAAAMIGLAFVQLLATPLPVLS
ncbi:hypothetical protein AGMMS49983_03150 [Clostridia bacterium]|nr:hypothetical protein AGMMS49983_03150 [Clostridia bacterium]